MSLLIVGSVALDSVETPHGRVEEALGGAAVYSAIAASIFTDVRLVGVVGTDFPEEHRILLEHRGIDLQGLQVADGRTFRWSGAYEGAMNEARTIDTQLNVFETFQPDLPPEYRCSRTLFLANIHPSLQAHVLDHVQNPELVGVDTMNLWINTSLPELKSVISRTDLLLVNDGEARMLTGASGVVAAGRELRKMGPHHVVVKKGEHGAMLFSGDRVFVAPPYPLEHVVDPTGAGDSFAGAMLGYLDSVEEVSQADWRRAVLYGTAVAAFTVEAFSVERLHAITREDVESRYRALLEMVRVDV